MSHEVMLIMVNEEEENTWHLIEDKKDGRGDRFSNDSSAVEVVERGGMDFIVDEATVSFTLSNGETYPSKKTGWVIPTAPFLEEPYELRQVVRATPVQNLEMAECVDMILRSEEARKLGVKLDIVATLKNGEITFFSLKLPDVFIGGREEEHHQMYQLIGNDHTKNLFFGETGIRTQCWNTWNMATRSGDLLKISHAGDPLAKLRLNTYMLQLFIREQEAMVNQLNNLFTAKIPSNEIDKVATDFFANVFPYPNPPKNKRNAARLVNQYAREADGNLVDDIKETARKADRDHEAAKARQDRKRIFSNAGFMQYNEEFSYAANTPYALVQGVTNAFSNLSAQMNMRTEGADHLARILFGDIASEQEIAFVSATKLAEEYS